MGFVSFIYPPTVEAGLLVAMRDGRWKLSGLRTPAGEPEAIGAAGDRISDSTGQQLVCSTEPRSKPGSDDLGQLQQGRDRGVRPQVSRRCRPAVTPAPARRHAEPR